MMISFGVVDLVCDVKLEQNFEIQCGQDVVLVKYFGDVLVVLLFVNINLIEFVVVLLDIMFYKVGDFGEFCVILLEFNGIGYGNIIIMEFNILDIVMSLFGNVSYIFEKELMVLFLVVCLGWEDLFVFG